MVRVSCLGTLSICRFSVGSFTLGLFYFQFGFDKHGSSAEFIIKLFSQNRHFSDHYRIDACPGRWLSMDILSGNDRSLPR